MQSNAIDPIDRKYIDVTSPYVQPIDGSPVRHFWHFTSRDLNLHWLYYSAIYILMIEIVPNIYIVHLLRIGILVVLSVNGFDRHRIKQNEQQQQ